MHLTNSLLAVSFAAPERPANLVVMYLATAFWPMPPSTRWWKSFISPRFQSCVEPPTSLTLYMTTWKKSAWFEQRSLHHCIAQPMTSASASDSDGSCCPGTGCLPPKRPCSEYVLILPQVRGRASRAQRGLAPHAQRVATLTFVYLTKKGIE